MATVRSVSKCARLFSCILLAAQMSAFAACALGFFEQPAFIAFLLPTLIANLVATAFQFTGNFAFATSASSRSHSD